MHSSPLVSVVLPTYNRAHTLARALDSVLAQTFQDFELVVVPDFSADDTAAVLARYAGLPQVRIIPSARRSCAAARNLGVAAGRSPLVAFQDSDDAWAPTHLEQAVTRLARTDAATGVYGCDLRRVRRDGTVTVLAAPEMIPGRLINETTLDYQPFGLGIQATVIKRECFSRVGGFDEAMPRFVDLELFLRLADAYAFVIHHEALVDYREEEGISTNVAALVTARRRLLGKYHARLRQHPHHLAMQYILLAQVFNQHGEKIRSAGAACQALAAAPGHPELRRTALQILRRRLTLR